MISKVVDKKDQAEAEKLFNSKQLDQLSILENSIGLLLARSRVPDNRIPVSVIKKSIEDVDLTGLRSDEQVRNRLQNVLGQLRNNVADLDRRIGNTGAKTVKFSDLPQ